MKQTLFNYLLDKQKAETISITEEKVMKMYLQSYMLMRYFDIAISYCKTNKIQKEVEELFPSWTGYENYYWYTYHYEGFGNALYSYTQVCEGILNYLGRKIDGFSKEGQKFLTQLVSNKSIKQILLNRHDSVHQFGKWREELSDELGLQNWKSAEAKVATPLLEAHEIIKTFNSNFFTFLNNQIQGE